jgi:hypothetical protein
MIACPTCRRQAEAGTGECPRCHTALAALHQLAAAAGQEVRRGFDTLPADPGAAAGHFARALEIVPGSPAARQGAALAALLAGDYPAALRHHARQAGPG